MSYTAPDLADDIERLLQERGYTIVDQSEERGVPGPLSEDGWTWSHTSGAVCQGSFDSQHAAVMDAVQHMTKAAELAALHRPKWAKAAGLHTWAFVTEDPQKQGAVFAGSHSNDWRGRAIIGSSDTETRHPTMIAAMYWVEEELKGAPAERLERVFKEAREKWEGAGKLLSLCDAIDAGYEAERSALDDEMLPLVTDLSENTAAIQTLVDAARDALEWMTTRGVVADERQALANALRAF